jgi:multidrug efflux pump subunit AcrA (membrane-fusion protein)
MAGSKQFRRYRGWIAGVALVAIATTAFFVLRNKSGDASTTTYETEAASVGTVSVTVAGTGNLEVDGTTEVYPAVAGTVDEVLVAEGDAVTTGTVLFTLDAASAEAATAKALASLRQAEQSVAQAQLQVTKAQNAYSAVQVRSVDPTPTATAADMSSAAGDLGVAKAQLASAQAQKTTASLAYDEALAAEGDLEVEAPCSGIVYSLGVSAGDSVTTSGGSSGSDTSSATSGMGGTSTGTGSSGTSSAPVTLAPAQPLAVHLTVNEVDLPSLEIGQRADIEFDALPDLTATGKVYEIGSVGSNSSGVVTFDVWVSLDVADPALRSGMSAAATIVSEVARNALIVSNSAVQSDGSGGYFVQVMANGSDTPQKVTVETGLASSTQTQILSGLAEGDLVVTQTVDSSDTSSSGTQQGPGGGGVMVPGMGGGFRD